MDDEQNDSPPETDGWVNPYGPTAAHPSVPDRPGQDPAPGEVPAPRQAPPTSAMQPASNRSPASADMETGKVLALLSHGGVLMGMPLFIIPMLQRDNEFALHHAKAAAVNFIFVLVTATLTIATCFLAFPLLALPLVPAIVGFVNAINGEKAGTWAWGPTGERMFKGVTVDETKQLEHHE